MSSIRSFNDAVDRDARRTIVRVVHRSQTSFYWAMRLTPPPRRDALFALYAFCRLVDDVADGPGPAAEKIAALTRWRDEVERLFGGVPTHPVARGLRFVVSSYDLRKADLLALIEGMVMDCAPCVRIEDVSAFDLYCDRVASSVGRMTNAIFGMSRDPSERLASSLGTALQITNILRDLKEDAARNRLYLPLEMLRNSPSFPTGQAGAFDDPFRVLADPLVANVLDDLACRAQALFDRSEDIIAELPRAQTSLPRMMKAFYQRVLTRMRRRGWGRWDRPPRLGKVEKAWAVFRGMV